MEQKLCQSCAMPLTDAALIGTNADGSKNEDYCVYCYADGHFTSDSTMDGMIETCLEFLDEFNKDSGTKLTREEAKAQMTASFPQLKRWKK
ncbi:hypothetical protein EZS27_039673 [termite gut metagenome]|uniref:Putative zinc ribbon domain-containing protein n=1 Tax=termite gut metagenome TaxID=433724 RepID=A0A5J4PJI1_9ZZZZ